MDEWEPLPALLHLLRTEARPRRAAGERAQQRAGQQRHDVAAQAEIESKLCKIDSSLS